MDTSETYIKMMRTAWSDIREDVYKGAFALFSRRLRMLYVLDGEIVYWKDSINTSNHDRAFPLLEQDQLQEMVRKYWEDDHESDHQMVERFYLYTSSEPPQGTPNEILTPLTTFERMWLAFVMKEKYSKVWSGTEWVSR